MIRRTGETHEIYNFDRMFDQVFKLLKNELSSRNFALVMKYEKVMVSDILAKATRLKQLKIILSLTKLLQKDGRYVQLVNADVEDAILSHYGIVKGEPSGPSMPKPCGICNKVNSPEAK